MEPPRQATPKQRQAKSVVRRIRDELSRKVTRDHLQKKKGALRRADAAGGNNHTCEEATNQLYHAQLESSLRRHLKPSLLRLDACVPVEKDVIYESAKVDASLRLSQQLYMLEFAFRKFAFRWRKIKLHSGLHLWQTNTVLLKAHLLHQKLLSHRAIQIQRAYRRKRSRDVAAAAERSLAEEIREMLRQQALAKARCQLEHTMAIPIQSHWRGLSCRLTWLCLLQRRLRRALDTLAAHQLFGGLEEVQIAGGHYYATSESDIEVIRQGHRWLRQRAPPFLGIQRLRCASEIELVGDRRAAQGQQCRAKQRHTFWSMMEAQLMEMSVAEARAVRLRERRTDRLRAKQEQQQRQQDELRGVRNLLHWQEARMCRERAENEAMAAEEAGMRRYLRELATFEAKLQSEHMKRSVALLKHAMRLQLDEQEQANVEVRRMTEADAAQRMTMDMAKLKTFSLHQGLCVVDVALRWDLPYASPVAAIEMLVSATSTTYPKTKLVHRVRNTFDIRRGLWSKLAQAIKTPLSRDTRAVHRKARRVEGCMVEFLSVRFGDGYISIGMTRCGNDGKTDTLSMTCPLIAVVSHLQDHQMVWLRPKNAHLMAAWIASRVKWFSPGRLVLLPPIEFAASMHSLQAPLTPVISELLQRGLHDLGEVIPKIFPP